MESGMVQDENMKMDFIKRIKKEAINMAGLINDILMISRLEAKDAEVVVSDVRISVLLDEITDSLKPAAASGQVFIHCDCQPLCIKANPKQMKELLSNLVSNAVKYNRPEVRYGSISGKKVKIWLSVCGIMALASHRKVLTGSLNVSTGWIRDAAGNRAVQDWAFLL